MPMRSSTTLLLAFTLVVSALAASADAVSFDLSRIVDLNTSIPDGAGTFTGLSAFAMSGGKLAIFGSGSSGQAGIYLFDGTAISRVADLSTGIPNGTGTFTGFGAGALSGNTLMFVGLGSGQHGLYLFDGTSIGAVADLNTAIPGGTGTFGSFFFPVLSDGNVAFRGEGSGQEGEYLFAGGGLSRIADLGTPIPNGTGNFTNFALPPHLAVNGGSVAFFALGNLGQQGIYLFNGSTLGRVADLTTPIPGGSGNFTGFGGATVLMDGTHIAFLGFGSSGQQGLYLFDGSTISRIVDANTAIPGGTGNFTNFISPELSGGTIAFIGDGTSDQRGIYLFDGNTLSRVAARGTMTPSGTGSLTDFLGMTLSQGRVAFYAQGPSSQQGIYLFDGTSISTVADLSAAIPNGTGKFSSFGFTPALDGQNLVFTGFGASSQIGFYRASLPAPPSVTPTPTVAPTPVSGKAAQKCRAALVNAAAALVQAEGKAERSCEDKKVRGKVPQGTSCPSDPKTSAAIVKVRSKLAGAVAKACGGKDKTCGSGGDDLPLRSAGWQAPSCPGIAGGSCTNTIATCADIATCLTCIGEATVGGAISLYYDDLVQTDPSVKSQKALNKCQATIGRAATSFLLATSKALAKCWEAVNAGKASGICPEAGSNAAGAIAKAESKQVSAICKACGGADKLCGGADDFTPADIGFAANCPNVMPPGSSSCGGVIGTLNDIVTCVGCVTEFQMDCAALAAVPGFATYPLECAP